MEREALFTSQVSSKYRSNYYIFIFLAVFLLLLSLGLKSFGVHYVFVPLACFFIYLGIQFHRTYLIIYVDGLKFQRPKRLTPKRFISWDKIRNINFYNQGMAGAALDFTSYKALVIFLYEKPYRIHLSEVWIDKPKEAFELIKNYANPYFYKSEFCELHSNKKIDGICNSCGKNLCHLCLEQFVRVGVLSINCSKCIYDNLMKKIPFFLGISFIPIIISIPFFILSNSIAFTAIVAIMLILTFIIVPYPYGAIVSARQRVPILKSLGLRVDESFLLIMEILVIISLFGYIIIFILFNANLLIIFFPWAFFYAILVWGITHPKRNALMKFK